MIFANYPWNELRRCATVRRRCVSGTSISSRVQIDFCAMVMPRTAFLAMFSISSRASARKRERALPLGTIQLDGVATGAQP
jgi:hypothetical protein